VDSFRCFYVIRPVLVRCLERTAWLNRHSAHPQLRSEVSAGSPEPSIVGHWQRPEESCQEPRACAVANQSSSEKNERSGCVGTVRSATPRTVHLTSAARDHRSGHTATCPPHRDPGLPTVLNSANFPPARRLNWWIKILAEIAAYNGWFFDASGVSY